MTIENMSVASVVAPSRTSAIIGALRHAILSGALPAGLALVEADLAQKFGTSKTPVREALKALVGAGLVTLNDYRGATVTLVDEDLARNVFDVRYLLEPVAVERTVTNGFDVIKAEHALNVGAATIDEVHRSLANRDFHQILYSGCGNSILIETLDKLRDQAALITVNAWSKRASWNSEADEHRVILASAASGDAAKTAELVRKHIKHFGNLAVEQMKRDQ